MITYSLRLRGKFNKKGESLKSTVFLSRSITMACDGTPPSDSKAKQWRFVAVRDRIEERLSLYVATVCQSMSSG